jgi:hypothetical protein
MEEILERSPKPQILRDMREQEVTPLAVEQLAPRSACADRGLRANQQKRAVSRGDREVADSVVETRIVGVAGDIHMRVVGRVRYGRSGDCLCGIVHDL